MTATVRTENDISVVTMDDGKANAISLDMLEAVNACLDEAESIPIEADRSLDVGDSESDVVDS